MESNDEQVSDIRAAVESAKAEERFEEAAIGLIDLAEKAESSEERAAAIEEAATLFHDKLGDPDQAAVLRRVLVELYEESEAFSEAANILEQLVDQGSEPVETLEQLAGIYAELEDWDKLVGTYDRLVERITESAEKIAVYRQRALIQKEALGKPDDALATQEVILTLDSSDAEAMDAVVKGYEERNRWEDLKNLLEGQAANNASERTMWLRRAAEAAGKIEGGIEEKNRLLAKILEENPDDTNVLETLEAQARENEDWPRVSDLLAQRAEAAGDVALKLSLWVEAGHILATRQADPKSAIPMFERALRAQKNHLPAIDGLLSALNATEQYELASKVYELKLHLSGGETQEIDARLAMAQLKLTKLQNRSSAMELYEETLQLDPDCREALVALGTDFLEKEAWIEATPLLERALQGFDDSVDPKLRADVLLGIARCSVETFNEERAKETYEAARQITALRADDLTRLAALYYGSDQLGLAQETYQQLLDKHSETLDSSTLGQVKIRLGECAAKMGQTALAMDYLSQMEDSSSQGIEELQRMVQVCATSENWSGVISHTEKLLQLRTDAIEKFQDMLTIADAYHQGLGQTGKAIEAFEAALKLGTFSRAPLLGLVRIHADAGHHEKTLDCLQQLADLEETAAKKSKWLMSMASVLKDSIKDVDRAMAMYEKILDTDRARLEAFEALVGVLNERGDIHALEAAHQRMIQRLQTKGDTAPDKKVLFMLYRNLGELYHQELVDRPKAIQAYENALLHHGNHEATREKVARLCVRTPEYLERAQFHYRLLISHYPENYTAYHSLSAIWASQGNLDGSWRIAGLLTLFNNAMDAEKRLYSKHLSPKPVATNFQFDDDSWSSHVRSREQSEELSLIFKLISPIILGNYLPKNAKALGLTKKQELTSETYPVFVRTAESTARLLGLPPIPLFIAGENHVAVTQSAEASLTISAEYAKETVEKAIAYHLARQMTYLRPQNRLARFFDSHALQGLYMAAGCAVNPNFAVRVHQNLPQEQADQAVHFIQEAALILKQQLQPETREQLIQAIEKVEPTFGTRTIEQWQRGVELTATFAGLVVVGDVLMVGRIIMEESVELSTLTNSDKMLATVGYALSERYTNLRTKMQVGVGFSSEA